MSKKAEIDHTSFIDQALAISYINILVRLLLSFIIVGISFVCVGLALKVYASIGHNAKDPSIADMLIMCFGFVCAVVMLCNINEYILAKKKQP